MRAAPGGFDRRHITTGSLCFGGGVNFSVGPLRN